MFCGCSAAAERASEVRDFLPPLDHGAGRKQLAREARRAIAQTLGLISHRHSPIGQEI